MNWLFQIDKSDFASLRALKTPPPGIDKLLCAMQCVIAGIHPGVPVDTTGKVPHSKRTWKEAQKLLSNARLLVECLGLVAVAGMPDRNYSDVSNFA